MPEPSPSSGPLRFSGFEVDLRAGELRKHGIRVKLQDQPFRVLQILLERPGQVVTREELQRQIWPSDTFVDFDRGLNNAVKRLREALADSAEEPRYIETLPKRGYRFIAPVETTNGHKGVQAEAPPVPLESPSLSVAKRAFPGPQLQLAFAVSVAIVGVSVAAVRLRDRFDGKVSAAPVRSIAVLPLQNLSGDPNQEYFADGMTEELITELSRLKDLKVISRTSVMRYKKTDKSLPEIAHELNVEAVVDGSVLRSGDRVRITAQLISAHTDANLWAETYDRSLEDTLALQEAVAAAIASKINTSMNPSAGMQGKRERTVDLKAHEAYLLGLHEDDLASEMSNHQGMRAYVAAHRARAIEYYRLALQQDPSFAPAYLELADVGNPNDVEIQSRKALELDDGLPRAHLYLGAVLLARDLNWRAAEREFLRAIEVNPNYAAAHQGYAFFLDAAGRLDEGLREYHRAQELDPANDHLGAALYTRRDYASLVELERRALATNSPGDTDPNAFAHKMLMVAYARTGKRKEAIEEMRSGIACMGFHDLAEEIRRGYMVGGYEGALRAYLSGAKKRPDWALRWVDIYAYTELGHYDQAFARLERLNKDDPSLWQFHSGDDPNGPTVMPTLASVRVEPMWDPLHSDPRFEELVRKVGLPTESVNH